MVRAAPLSKVLLVRAGQGRAVQCDRGAIELNRGSRDHLGNPLQEVPTTTYSNSATALRNPPRQLVDNLLLQLHSVYQQSFQNSIKR